MHELDKQITERIFDQTVLNVYSVWKNRGLLAETCQILEKLPEDDTEIISYSFTTHVHKEKGLFLDLLGERAPIPDGGRKALAVSADLLWALSLMVDDIEDNDSWRGDRASSWVKYGKQKTITAGLRCLDFLIKHLVFTTGNPLIGESCLSYVKLGLKSLSRHRHMNLDTPMDIINHNYEQRCDFHGTFQLVSMYGGILGIYQPEEMNRNIAGLRALNKSGQLINDLKDVAAGDLYHRSYSDIRNGVPTIPLILIYRSTERSDANFLRDIFGRGTLDYEQKNRLQQIISESSVVSRTMSRIDDTYQQSLDLLSSQLDSQELGYLESWVQYKSNSVRKQLGLC